MDISQLRTFKGQSFLGEIQVGALAGTYSAALVFNPAGSGVLMLVRSILLTNSPQCLLASANAPFATPGFSAGNKLVGGPGTKLSGYVQQNAGANVGAAIYFANINPGAATYEFPFAEPMIVPEGKGLGVWGSTLNAAINLTMEWDEVSG